jgi:hypothetical protein
MYYYKFVKVVYEKAYKNTVVLVETYKLILKLIYLHKFKTKLFQTRPWILWIEF